MTCRAAFSEKEKNKEGDFASFFILLFTSATTHVILSEARASGRSEGPACSKLVSRPLTKDLPWTRWESFARRLKSRIWTCAARAKHCRRRWSIPEASLRGSHAG